MSTDFILKIRKQYRSLRPAERKVADQIIGGDFDAEKLTLEELADRAQVSQPTVIRFARAMELDGFRELKRTLMKESLLAEGKSEMTELITFDISPDEKPVDIPMKVINASVRQLEDTLKNLSVLELMRAARTIAESGTVLLLAAENSSTVAEDLASKLIYLGINAVYYQDIYRQSMMAGDLTERDTAVGISYTGLSRSTVRALQNAKEAGARTITLTNYEDTAINRYADIILCTGTEQYIYSNALYSRCGQLAVVDMLYACILLSDYDRYSRKIKKQSDISDGFAIDGYAPL